MFKLTDQMTVELIPVIEIGYHHPAVETPQSSPYWEHPEIWQAYFNECYKESGLPYPVVPYTNGSGFSRLTDVSNTNLIKIIDDHFEGVINGEWTEEDTIALYGGYVLKVDGQDQLFPQGSLQERDRCRQEERYEGRRVEQDDGVLLITREQPE